MPIFELACTNCEYSFEFFQVKQSEKIPQRCPRCRYKLEKVVGVVSSMYVRGKNPNWPLTETTQDNKPSGAEYD
jgi:putative FmdB family regulatory protein